MMTVHKAAISHFSLSLALFIYDLVPLRYEVTIFIKVWWIYCRAVSSITRIKLLLFINYVLAAVWDTFELTWALLRFSTDDTNACLTYRYFVDICVMGVVEGRVFKWLWIDRLKFTSIFIYFIVIDFCVIFFFEIEETKDVSLPVSKCNFISYLIETCFKYLCLVLIDIVLERWGNSVRNRVYKDDE